MNIKLVKIDDVKTGNDLVAKEIQINQDISIKINFSDKKVSNIEILYNNKIEKNIFFNEDLSLSKQYYSSENANIIEERISDKEDRIMMLSYTLLLSESKSSAILAIFFNNTKLYNIRLKVNKEKYTLI